MGATVSLALPKIVGWIGTVIGAIGTAKMVDDVVGQPLQRELGLVDETPELPEIDYGVIESERAQVEEAKTRSQGLQNYLRSLEALAPSYVHRNRSKLKENYNTAIDNREAERKELETL
jgi:hypothetical protein